MGLLTNTITDPTDTPFMSGAEKEKATAVNHEWQTQAPASSSNAQLEGDDPSANAVVPRVRLGNLCQILYKMAQVSGTRAAKALAGGYRCRSSESRRDHSDLVRDRGR